MFLSDLDQPIITISPSAKEGYNITLPCNANTSEVISNYTWFHDGKEIQESKNGALKITNIKRTATGSYNCTAKTKSFQTSSTTDLKVLCK